MAEPIEITARPCHQGPTGTFDVYVGGRYLVTSPTPFGTSADILMILEGKDPDTVLIMTDDAGSMSLQAPLGFKNRHYAPKFVRYHPNV